MINWPNTKKIIFLKHAIKAISLHALEFLKRLSFQFIKAYNLVWRCIKNDLFNIVYAIKSCIDNITVHNTESLQYNFITLHEGIKFLWFKVCENKKRKKKSKRYTGTWLGI